MYSILLHYFSLNPVGTFLLTNKYEINKIPYVNNGTSDALHSFS